MTRDDSQSCLAFSEEHCWYSSLLSHALLGTIQSELSTTLKLSPRPSFTPIHLQVYIIGTVAFTFIELQPRLDSKRNRRRWRRVKIITKHYHIVYSLRASNDIRATELLLNTIIMLPHIVYKLYVLPFYLFTRRKRKR